MSQPVDIKPIPTPDETVDELTKNIENTDIDPENEKEPYIPEG